MEREGRTLDPGIKRSDDEEKAKELQGVAWSAFSFWPFLARCFSLNAR
jgi:hypothetical protein